MLARIFSPLVFLLGIVGLGDAQYGFCDYEQYIEPGKSYYIFSPDYQNNANYTPGAYCRWTAKSDRPIQMRCNPFMIPESNRCSVDVVIIQTSNRAGQRYCGDGEINVISEGNQLVVALQSSGAYRVGGRFFCTLQTVQEQVDNCRCGWKNDERIVGGKETGINEYPMMAGIIDATNKILYCGATIINNQQVVTAAHCVASNSNPMTLGVLVGEHDLTRRDETNATQLFKILNYVIHPQYSSTTQDYDIAIITVSGTIRFSQEVGPVCLPFQHAPDTFAGNFVNILGWGTTDFAGPQSQTLQKAELSVITPRQCQQSYARVGTRQLCTLEAGKDSCQFDSGGPVIWRNPTTKRLVLVGLISYGSICADGTPAVNTRVGAFINWIVSQSPPDFQYCDSE